MMSIKRPCHDFLLAPNMSALDFKSIRPYASRMCVMGHLSVFSTLMVDKFQFLWYDIHSCTEIALIVLKLPALKWLTPKKYGNFMETWFTFV